MAARARRVAASGSLCEPRISPSLLAVIPSPTDAATPLPVLLQIDCEPDLRTPEPDGQTTWHGLPAMAALLADWRRQAERVTGAPVALAWFWRADPQLGELHGDPAWALRHFAGPIERQMLADDCVGLHAHCWRRAEDGQGWINEHGDAAWVAQCLETGYAAFQACLGRVAEDFRMGDGFMDQAAFDRLVALGMRREQSLEPGRPAMPGLRANERNHGNLPDRRAMPVEPYRPSPQDYLRAAPAGDPAAPVWVVPCTTGSMLPPSDPAAPGATQHQANLAYQPGALRRILLNGLAKPRRPYLSVAVRSASALAEARDDLEANLAFLLRLAAERPLRFVTAAGLLSAFGLA